MATRGSLISWLRIVGALIAFAFGLLAFASGLLGPEPLKLGGSEHEYYQIVATPSPYYWLWGVLGFVVGAGLLALPLLGRGKGRQ